MSSLLNTNRSIKIFFCYAHKDKKRLNKLKKHLEILRKSGFIEWWHDKDISAGTEWEPQISEHLSNADIILLLISSDFMASDYCYSQQMQRALERHRTRQARVIPVILRPVYWKCAPFSQLQALPNKGKPVSNWLNKDKAYKSITKSIMAIIKDLGGSP